MRAYVIMQHKRKDQSAASAAARYRGKMDEKLILTVFNFPELYNVTLPNYRNGDSRCNAWTRISALTGLQPEECKRKWKNLRDRYLKEVRQENRAREQGELIPSRWKFRQLLNFLAPFSKSRHGGAIPRDDDDEDPESPDDASEATGSDIKTDALKMGQTTMTSPSTQAGAMSQLAFVTQLSQGPQMAQLAFLAKLPPGAQMAPAPQQSSARKRSSQVRELESPASPCSSSTSAKLPAKTKRENDSTHTTRGARDEDELFLLSFVPALKRLAPQKRCETKMRIQQIMYEAEFSMAPESEQPDTDG